DTANPPNGFTNEEYRGFGVTFDTLMAPVDSAAFGQPSDIDANGRVILFFTRAVNELTPPGSPGRVLGFFYRRDLLPTAQCPTSNAGEMFYLLVPDPDTTTNNGRIGMAGISLSRDDATRFTNGTVAHEYQHLINGSRRLYVNVGA